MAGSASTQTEAALTAGGSAPALSPKEGAPHPLSWGAHSQAWLHLHLWETPSCSKPLTFLTPQSSVLCRTEHPGQSLLTLLMDQRRCASPLLSFSQTHFQGCSLGLVVGAQAEQNGLQGALIILVRGCWQRQWPCPVPVSCQAHSPHIPGDSVILLPAPLLVPDTKPSREPCGPSGFLRSLGGEAGENQDRSMSMCVCVSMHTRAMRQACAQLW